MVKKHLKQIAVPKSWPVQRKSSKFVTRPTPGAHSFETGIALALALTNLVHVAKTTKEASSILYKEEVLVDMTRRKSPKYAVGFLDSIAFPKTKEAYRIFKSNKGVLTTIPIEYKEAALKIAKVENKKILPKGKIQLNLNTGRNIIVEKDNVKVGDSLLLELPTQKINKTISLEKGSSVMLLSAKHIGTIAKVQEINGQEVLVKSGTETFLTTKEAILVVGKTKSEITLPE